MPVQRVVVEIHLGVEADDLAVLGHHQRIDFQKAHVLGDKGVVEAFDHRAALLDLVAPQLECGRDLIADIARIARRRFDLKRRDLVRRLVRDFFDVHAAFGGNDEGDAAGGAIDESGEI